MQDSSFYKNMAIVGGILFVFVAGAGRLSLDALLRKKTSARLFRRSKVGEGLLLLSF